MKLTDTAKNLMLDAMDESIATGMKYASAHTAYSATGTNEVTGGSPAYARKALTWSAAASGSKAMAATFPVFDVPPSTTIAWLGFWDAVTAGNFLGMTPLGAGVLKPMASEAGDLAGNTIQSKAHGYAAGQAVVFWGANLPAGLSVGTIYYVIATGLTTDLFEVSTTLGGSAVDITAVGGGLVQAATPETYTGQGTYTVSAGSLDLSAVA